MDQGPVSNNSTHTGSKRRRIAIACNTCRTRKSKCDGRRPTCSTCHQSNFECQYDAPDSSTNVIVQKEYVSDLERRLQVVELALQRHDNLLTGHLSACEPSTSRKTHVQYEAPFAGGRASPSMNQTENGIHIVTSSLEEPGRNDSRTDGLAITFVDEHASAYFGESSNIAFVRYLLPALSAIWHVRKPEKPSIETGEKEKERDLSNVSHLVEVRGEHSPMSVDLGHASDMSALVLPSVTEMENLLRVYFGTHGLLFSFLHEPTFWKTYRDFEASGFSRVRRTWLGVLHMVFAMASNVDQGKGMVAKERLKQSEVFYARAVALCSGPSRRTISLDIVHYLLLAVLYLQGTQRSIQTWNLHGLLVRTAIALGLHSDQAGQHLDDVQQEVRRRTWQTIYCLDKVLSVTFGRPPAIMEEQMTVQLPRLWPPAHGSSGYDGINRMQFTTEFLSVSLGLYKIMGKSVAKQYGSNLGNNDPDWDNIITVQFAGEMRQELRRWVSSLPSDFSICPAGSPVFCQSSDLNRLRTVLTLRYHNLSILIHRPLLSATLKYLSRHNSSENEDLPYTVKLAIEEAHDCVLSAENTINIVHSVLAADITGQTNLGVWFFTLYYVFTASLMVCARMLWAQHGSSQTSDAVVASGRAYLIKAAEALQMLDDGNDLVQQCAKYIHYLSRLQDGRISSNDDRIGYSDHATGEAPQEISLPFNGYEASSNQMTDLNDFVINNGDLGPLFDTELLDSSLFGGF